MIKISTSILASNNRIESIKKLNKTNTDYIHLDVMDGKFVPNIQMPVNEIINYAKYAQCPLDIHLMVEEPELYITKLGNLTIEYITVHLEITKNIKEVINQIKSLGYKAGISLKPDTNIQNIIPYLSLIDLVLIMSVEPGYGGQTFIPNSLTKAKELKTINPSIIIEMDGGINNTNIKQIKEVTDIAVVGSYITNQEDYNQAINFLKN